MAHCGALRQFAQNILNACDEYERQVNEANEESMTITSKTEVVTNEQNETE